MKWKEYVRFRVRARTKISSMNKFERIRARKRRDISARTSRRVREKALPAECVHIDASIEPEIPGPTSKSAFLPSFLPFYLPWALPRQLVSHCGLSSAQPERVQRRVWATQEISVRLWSGGRIALLWLRTCRCSRSKCTETHNVGVPGYPGVAVADSRGQPRADRILPWNSATSRILANRCAIPKEEDIRENLPVKSASSRTRPTTESDDKN